MTKPAAFYASVYKTGTVPGRKVYQLVLEGPIEEYRKVLEAIGDINPATSTWLAIARLNPETVKEVMPTELPPGAKSIDTQSREEVMPDTDIRSQPQRNDTSPASGPDIPARAHKPVAADKRLAQRAALLCKDPMFHRYVDHALSDEGTNEEDAITYVRNYCDIQSRSEIKPSTEAGRLFDHLYSRFVAWRDADIYVEASA